MRVAAHYWSISPLEHKELKAIRQLNLLYTLFKQAGEVLTAASCRCMVWNKNHQALRIDITVVFEKMTQVVL